jgi:hypothetical protein
MAHFNELEQTLHLKTYKSRRIFAYNYKEPLFMHIQWRHVGADEPDTRRAMAPRRRTRQEGRI